MKDLHSSIVLITGGTGSFGQAFVEQCIKAQVKEIRVFSRDETKQHELKNKFPNQNLHCFIGDIRDIESLNMAMQNVDYVFHAAAMKHVPICEQYPIEAFKTNVLGTENVIKSAIEHHVKTVVVLSTDKAVYPISTMGISKSYMEKIALYYAQNQTDTKICITRFANLINSRGAVFSIFNQQIQNHCSLTFTDPNMTRFFMSVKDAVDLIQYALLYGQHGDILIYMPKACSIQQLADGIAQYYNTTYTYEIVGARPGERIDEALITLEELPYIVFNKENSIITIPLYKKQPMQLFNYSAFHSNYSYNIYSAKELLALIQSVMN